MTHVNRSSYCSALLTELRSTDSVNSKTRIVRGDRQRVRRFVWVNCRGPLWLISWLSYRIVSDLIAVSTLWHHTREWFPFPGFRQILSLETRQCDHRRCTLPISTIRLLRSCTARVMSVLSPLFRLWSTAVLCCPSDTIRWTGLCGRAKVCVCGREDVTIWSESQ